MTTATSFSLTIQGQNFGRLADSLSWSANERAIAVAVGGVACAPVSRVVVGGVDVLQCSIPMSAVVGYKNLSVTIAGQTAFIPPTDPRTVLVVCASASFGRTGETCAPCPVGSTCAGYVANAGVDLRSAVGSRNGTLPFFLGGVEVDFAGLHTYPSPISGFFNLNGTSKCPF